MKKIEYYLYLESYVFLFVRKENALLYDSFSGNFYPLNFGGELRKVLEDLLELKNMYVVPMTAEMLNDKYVQDFVHLVRTHFLGDLVPVSICHTKPILFPAVLDFQFNKTNAVKEKGEKVLSNLNELIIYATGACSNETCSQNCNSFSKQSLFCKKENDASFLDIHILKSYLDSQQLKELPIHIVGGDLSSYPYWNDLAALSSEYEKMDYYIHIHRLRR